MPKHPGQKIGQRNANHEKHGQTVIHLINMDRWPLVTLSQIKSGHWGWKGASTKERGRLS
jgi:hypothetical protein